MFVQQVLKRFASGGMPPRYRGFRLHLRRGDGQSLVLWYVVTTLVVFVLPSLARLRQLPWELPPGEQLQAWVWVATYLLISLACTLLASRPAGTSLAPVLLTTGICWCGGYLLLLAIPGISHSRLVALASAVLGSLLSVLPLLYGRRVRVAFTGISAAAVGVLWMVRSTPTEASQLEPLEFRRVSTALLPLKFVHQRGLVDAGETQGGAIARLGDAFILATAKGALYQLSWNAADSLLHATRLSISVPVPLDEPAGDPASAIYPPMLRVTGLAVESRGDSTTVYVAHEHWDRTDACVSVRVSRSTLPRQEPDRRASAPWHTLFSSRPCVRPKVGFDPFEAGGRLVRRPDGKLLLTLGHYGLPELLSGTPSAIVDSDYGKVLVIDPAGTLETFSAGHRNPQGLLIDAQDRVWSTEHGPQGGDELNLLHAGAHYGWPYTTPGTKYGSYRWPAAEKPTNLSLTEPLFAFAQAIGISNLIEIRHSAFDAWKGDLLIGSLLAESLFRVRVVDSRVQYIEPIPVGARIRDLVEGADGRIVLWTDFGELIVVSPELGTLSGALVYEQCSRCHRSNLRGSPLGPPLVGVVGRRVASQPGFVYSDALRSLRGAWTEDRLDAFLRDPLRFAPGTSMMFDGIGDTLERRALIAFLRGN